ncbi:ferric reductase-like transmembrane domain-containing protein [Sporolactobacillus sp. CPB3-1]|uniref:Ferric reductase-like transmembrane domain-containing protein n=1 Tax=Sporolactobacillus mangiferae TaxID=2940498 RepID=A0ABT0M9S0_9BACL|nr:ferric reductase-like transmembrane domain-containing protein [Sporolactobacillus mangiferae]MCL1631620.1 ferric reductase-like transmembrane domain-containing protein [Sporolactobacillus mangiferae]
MNTLLASVNELMPVWNVSRAAGITSYLLLFASVITGMSAHYSFMKASTRARINLIHQSAGWFGILLGMIHGLVLVFSTYESFSIWNVLIPFTSSTHPLLIGIGVLALDTFILLIVTSDYMKALGRKTWKAIHFLAFPAFAAAFLHGILLGPDTHQPLMLTIYIVTAATAVLALAFRIAIREPRPIPAKPIEQSTRS